MGVKEGSSDAIRHEPGAVTQRPCSRGPRPARGSALLCGSLSPRPRAGPGAFTRSAEGAG